MNKQNIELSRKIISIQNDLKLLVKMFQENTILNDEEFNIGIMVNYKEFFDPHQFGKPLFKQIEDAIQNVEKSVNALIDDIDSLGSIKDIIINKKSNSN